MPEVSLRAADGGSFSGYLAVPARHPAPGVVVLQEIFGVNAFVRQVVEEYAARGFIALAPDIFWRQQPGVQLTEADREQAQQYLKNLDERLAVEDAVAAMSYLRALPHCTGKVGAVGYCLGGKLAYLMATRSNVNAAVSYYGVGIQNHLSEAPNIRCPLLLHIGGADPLCPPEAQAKIITSLQPRAERVTIATYEGAGHAFARRGGAPYMREPAERADATTEEFLSRGLR
jgi:carboxymethylenebutenolidase